MNLIQIKSKISKNKYKYKIQTSSIQKFYPKTLIFKIISKIIKKNINKIKICMKNKDLIKKK